MYHMTVYHESSRQKDFHRFSCDHRSVLHEYCSVLWQTVMFCKCLNDLLTVSMMNYFHCEIFMAYGTKLAVVCASVVVLIYCACIHMCITWLYATSYSRMSNCWTCAVYQAIIVWPHSCMFSVWLATFVCWFVLWGWRCFSNDML